MKMTASLSLAPPTREGRERERGWGRGLREWELSWTLGDHKRWARTPLPGWHWGIPAFPRHEQWTKGLLGVLLIVRPTSQAKVVHGALAAKSVRVHVIKVQVALF